MTVDMKELEQRIEEAEKSMLLAKEAYDTELDKLAKLLEKRDRIRRGLDGGRISLDQWKCSWDGEAVWDYGTGIVQCFYEAEMVLGKEDTVIHGPEVQKLETEKPGFTAEDVIVALQDSLCAELDAQFEFYCTAEDYYQPVVEDFEAESYAREWAEKRGIKLISFEGEGSDGGFEPKHRRW